MSGLNDYLEEQAEALSHLKSALEDDDKSLFELPMIRVMLVIHSWILLEGFLNLVSRTAKSAHGLKPHEVAFLREARFDMNDRGEFYEKTTYNSTSSKILYLLARFSKKNVQDFKTTKTWSNIKDAEKIRDKLVHPKYDLEADFVSKNNALHVYSSVVAMVRYINKYTLKSGSDWIKHL